MSDRVSVAVVGGGVSGLGAAWKLAAAGKSVLVLEAGETIGGLARTAREDGYCLDVGPHSFFSHDADVVRRVLDLFEEPLTPTRRTVKFLFRDRYLDYPLTAQSVLTQMGPLAGLRAGISYIWGKLLPHRSDTIGTEQETVEDWALSSFGEYLYRSFFKPYTEQFWKAPCRELSSRSIPTHTKMSFANTLRAIVRRRASPGGDSLVDREALPTYYPRTGFGEIPERMAAAVCAAGGEIRTGCRVTRMEAREGHGWRVTFAASEGPEAVECERVISTIPLCELVPMLQPAPPLEVLAASAELDYRALVVLGMVTEKQDILGCGYIYVLNRPYNRVSEMNVFGPDTSPPGENILAVEMPCLRGSTIWKADREALFEMCIGPLAEDGLLQPGDVKRLVLVKDPFAYPVYRRDYAVHLRTVMAYLGRHEGLCTLGRSGEFRYMDVDECIARAMGEGE